MQPIVSSMHMQDAPSTPSADSDAGDSEEDCAAQVLLSLGQLQEHAHAHSGERACASSASVKPAASATRAVQYWQPFRAPALPEKTRRETPVQSLAVRAKGLPSSGTPERASAGKKRPRAQGLQQDMLAGSTKWSRRT